MPSLSLEASIEVELTSDEENDEDQDEVQEEALADHSETPDFEPQRYKSLAQVYSETNPMNADEDCLSAFEEPVNYYEAVRDEQWKRAMIEEMNAIDRSQTWELTAPPANCRPIGLKWIYKLKKNAHGEIIRHKA